MFNPSGGGFEDRLAGLPPELRALVEQRLQQIQGGGGMRASVPPGVQGAPVGDPGLPGPGTPGWFRDRRRMQNGGGGMQSMPMPQAEPDLDDRGGPPDFDLDDSMRRGAPPSGRMGGPAGPALNNGVQQAPAVRQGLGGVGAPQLSFDPGKAPSPGVRMGAPSPGPVLSGGNQGAPAGGRMGSPSMPPEFLAFLQNRLGRR